MTKRVYLKTTIISYLAARPSRDLIVPAHQELTRRWWDNRAGRFALYVGELVLEEAAKGDADAAARRIAVAKSAGVLAVDGAALSLAAQLVEAGAVPESATADALHVAVAAVNSLDFLLTWNCVHINNAGTKHLIESVCSLFGHECPTICTPEELMGVEP